MNLKKKKKNRNIGMINIVIHQKNIKKIYVKVSNNNGYSSGDEEDGFYANEYSRPKKSKSEKNKKVMYVPVNEDEVDFSESNFTDDHDFQDEDDTIDDDEKNDEMVIDDKYLDDEELSKLQTKKQLKKRNGISNYIRK